MNNKEAFLSNLISGEMDPSKLKNFFWKWPTEINFGNLEYKDFIEEIIEKEKENVNLEWERRTGKTWTSIYVAFRKAMKRKQDICYDIRSIGRKVFGVVDISELFINLCNIEAKLSSYFLSEREVNILYFINEELKNNGRNVSKLQQKYPKYMSYIETLSGVFLMDHNSSWKSAYNKQYAEYKISFANGSNIYITRMFKVYDFLPLKIACVIIEDEYLTDNKCIHHNKITFNTIVESESKSKDKDKNKDKDIIQLI